MSPPQNDSSSLSADDFAVYFRRKSIRFVRQRLVHLYQLSTSDLLMQLRCRVSDQSTLLRSHVCCHVFQLSTVNLIRHRPGSLQSSVWCAMRHCNLEFFLTHTNMPLFFHVWRSHHLTLTIWTLIGQFRTPVLSRSLLKELLQVDIFITLNRTNCFLWNSPPTDVITALSLQY